jgi:hypothetical protein
MHQHRRKDAHEGHIVAEADRPSGSALLQQLGDRPFFRQDAVRLLDGLSLHRFGRQVLLGLVGIVGDRGQVLDGPDIVQADLSI